MNPEDLLRASRNVHLLVRKPGSAAGLSWNMCLHGLHQVHIKEAVKALRQDRQQAGDTISHDSLKPKALQNAVASAFGMKSYDDWLTKGQQSLITFLHDQGMTRPTDLITWKEGRPGHGETLTAQRIADRLFNSGLPLPRRIFTGSGSLIFAAHGYGNFDLSELISKEPRGSISGYCLPTALDYCERHAQVVVFRATRLDGWAEQTPDYLDLTGYQMLLNAFGFEAGTFFNLLGCSLVDPPTGDLVLRLYNASQEEIATYQRLYAVFRSEIERSSHGWVEVIPFPGNENIIFLKGPDGAFDWVVRDQRDEALSDNPYYPFLHKAELPSAMKDAEGLESHLYYQRGEWREQLEHDAEARHYKEGGSTSDWPGYAKLVQRELAASRNYAPTKRKQGASSAGFSPVRLHNYSLMVSQLITIEDFWRFLESSPWQGHRNSRSKSPRPVMSTDLSPVNLSDPGHLPASVTWFDAIAYCQAYEEKTGLPVRLMSIEEWREVFRGISNFDKPTKNPELEAWHHIFGSSSEEKDYSALPRAVSSCGLESLQYAPDLIWRTTENGLRCLYARDFGEWLQDYHAGSAPAVCAATEESVVMGPLERAVLPADCTMRYKGMKVGFRLCYVSRPDA